MGLRIRIFGVQVFFEVERCRLIKFREIDAESGFVNGGLKCHVEFIGDMDSLCVWGEMIEAFGIERVEAMSVRDGEWCVVEELLKGLAFAPMFFCA